MKPPNNGSLSKINKGSILSPKSLFEKGSFFMPENGVHPFFPGYHDYFLTPEQQTFYGRRHSLLLKSLRVEIVSDMNRCKLLWEKFSPQAGLFDTWDFRFAFWQGYRYQPFFVVLRSLNEVVAVLPLWHEEDKGRYTWFGSPWQEENRFFVTDPLYIPLLLAVAPSPLHLNSISTELPKWAKDVIKFGENDSKYVLNLKEIGNLDQYLQTLKKKKRYNLKRDRRFIQAKRPQVFFDRDGDIKTLVELSNQRFHQKGEDTDWEDPRRVETFRWVVKLGYRGQSYRTRMISVEIDGQPAAVDLVLICNGCYYPVKCGYDVGRFSGIGNYMNLFEIEDAINLGLEKMDFLEINYGWKDKWFEAVPMIAYDKN